MPQSKKQMDNLLRGNPDTQFQSGREQVEIARKGGIASGEARRRNKTFAEMAKRLSDIAPSDPKSIAALAKLGIEQDEATQGMLIVAAMFKEAVKGNVKAAKLVAEWMESAPLTIEEQSNDPLSVAFEKLESEDEN